MSVDLVTDLFLKAEQAQLTKSDVAALSGVSRETLYRWLNGRPCRDKRAVHLVKFVTKRLHAAIANKKLPLPEKLKTEERREAVRAIFHNLNTQQS